MKFKVSIESKTPENEIPGDLNNNELHIEFDGSHEEIVGAIVGAMLSAPELKRLLVTGVAEFHIYEAMQMPPSKGNVTGEVVEVFN